MTIHDAVVLIISLVAMTGMIGLIVWDFGNLDKDNKDE